jgi:hypothetical protein
MNLYVSIIFRQILRNTFFLSFFLSSSFFSFFLFFFFFVFFCFFFKKTFGILTWKNSISVTCICVAAERDDVR